MDSWFRFFYVTNRLLVREIRDATKFFFKNHVVCGFHHNIQFGTKISNTIVREGKKTQRRSIKKRVDNKSVHHQSVKKYVGNITISNSCSLGFFDSLEKEPTFHVFFPKIIEQFQKKIKKILGFFKIVLKYHYWRIFELP